MRADMPSPAALLWALALTVFAANTPAAQPTVTVRGGDHPQFSRIVFDFAVPPPYEAALEGERLVITFDRPFAFDFGRLPAEPLERLADPAVVREDGETHVALSAAPGTQLRHFLVGPSLVVDAVESQREAEAAAAEPAQAVPAKDPAAERATLEATTDELEPEPEQEVVSSTPARAEEDIGKRASVPVGVEPIADGIRLTYRWPTATEAAVFLRAGHLWVVFAESRRIDHSALDWRPDMPLGARLGRFDRLAADEQTVLRYRLRKAVNVEVERAGTHWQIALREGATYPARAIEPVRRREEDGASLFIAGEEIGPRLTVTDPAVGDVLEIVPLGDAGRAMATERRFVEFRLAATAQGVVLEPLAPGIRLVRYANGVAVEGRSGLTLSQPRLGADFADAVPRRLVDLPAWRRNGGKGFTETEHAMLARLGTAPAGGRRAARWDLARFYLAHGHAAEARGILDLMAETDPDLAESPAWRAVSGVADLELGRPEQALKTLLAEELDREREIWLWRALAAEASGRPADALAYYARGREALDSHEPAFRTRVRLAIARAALERETLDVAEEQVAALQRMQLAGSAAAEADFLYGRLAEARGDMATAVARYRDATAASDRRISAAARLALTKLLLAEGDIDREEAIARLERLRFAWRGDEVELSLLRMLGRLHVEAGQYRKGLEAYRTAATTFPDTPEATAVTNRMSGVFRGLFLGGGAERLSPLEALALFYDFRELTPLGSEGDRMIRRLVDRLVAVDLLDRAADLLKHQVDFRLEGLGRAVVATRLAKIYLLDHRPEKALETLQSTRDRAVPVEILRERALVEARALAELGRYEEALALLEDDNRPAAAALEADIYWQRRDWPALARLSAEIMGERWREDTPLAPRERIAMMRWALALSFTDRRTALRELRERYGPLMEGGEFAGMFNLLTSDDPPPAGELARIAGDLSNSDRYRAFLSAYREEFTVQAAEGTPPPEAGAVANAS